MAAAVDAYLRWPPWKKLFSMAFSCLVLAVGYYFLPGIGIKAQQATLSALKDEYTQLERKVSENKAIADNLSRVKEEVDQLDEKLERAKKKLPDKEEIPIVLKTVSELGKEAGLEFLLFRPGKPVPKDFYAEVPLELEMIGRYHDLAAFFDKVGKLSRIVTIEDIKFGKAVPGEGGMQLTVSCRAVTFKFSEAAAPQAVNGGNKKGEKK